jgi:hypothetical protein
MWRFNDLLGQVGIAPTDVHVILHSPRQRALAGLLPYFAAREPEVLEAFQASHSVPAERVLQRKRPYVASFVRLQSLANGTSKLCFAGVFEHHGWTSKTAAQILANPSIQRLRALDPGVYADLDPGRAYAWFDLRRSSYLAEYVDRLIIEARLTQSYVRLSENLDAPILALLETGHTAAPLPPWRDLILSAAQIRALPSRWQDKLLEWRGIYHILDTHDGARYVGAAYGQDNLLGRWRAHIAGDMGITKELSKRDPNGFVFTILERTSPDLPAEDVIALEQTWMARLHTKEYGLNT